MARILCKIAQNTRHYGMPVNKALGIIMGTIELRKIWEDSDGMIQVEISISNGSQATTQDFYTYPDEIGKFGADLANYFPKLGKGEVTFEYGAEEDNVYSFVYIKAFYITLHSIGLLVKTNNNQKGYESAISEFCIKTTLSEINRVGINIENWAKSMNKPLKCQLKNA